MTNEIKLENKMLREVVNNFLGCLKDKVVNTELFAPCEFVLEAFDYCYKNNYIRPMMLTEFNEEFVSRHAMEIQRCMLYIQREFGNETLCSVYDMFDRYSVSHYVIDVHYYTIKWFIHTYNIYDVIAERLGIESLERDFQLTDETFKVITEVFEEKIEEHSDEYLFY